MDTLVGVSLLLIFGGLALALGGTAWFFLRLRGALRSCDDTGNPITGQSPPSYSAPCPVCVEIHDPLPCPRQEMGSDGYGTIPCSGCCGFRLPGEPCAWLGCRSHNPPHVSRPAREVWGPSIRARQRIGLALLLLFAGTGPAWAVCISGQEGRDQQVEPLPAYPASAGGCSAKPQAPGEGAVPVVVVGLAVMVGLVLRRRLWIAALLLLTTGPVWAYNRVGANHGDRYAPQTLTAPRDPPAPKEATSPGVQYRYGGGPDVGATPSDRLVLQQAAQPSLPWKRAAVALLLLLAGWYARLRWGGGVLRVRGCEVFHWGQPSGWWVRRALLYRSDHPTVRTHYQDYDHNTLPGAIWSASVDGHHARRQPYCIWERQGDRCGQGGHVCAPRTHRGRVLGRTCQWWQRSLGRLGIWCPWHKAALRGLPVLLLLLCGGCDKPKTKVTQLPAACWTAPRTAPWGAWTCDSVWSQHWARAYAGCQDAHHREEERLEALIADAHEPPRWPWVLLGGLLSALVWLPLGAWGLLRIEGERQWRRMVRPFDGRRLWIARNQSGRWFLQERYADGYRPKATERRWWWQALRDAWRLSRGKEVQ